MKFDITEYVTSNLVSVKTTATGELIAECPWCGRYGGFYVSPKTGNFICFKCDEKGRHLVGVVAQVEGISWQEAKRFILQRTVEFRRRETPQTLLEKIKALRPSDGEPTEENELVEVELPEEFTPVFQDGKWKFPKYLKQRGIDRRTAKIWGLGFCDSGRYEGRVIVPIECPNGYSFAARDTTGLQEPKILHPRFADHGKLLIGWDHVKPGSDVAIVEGPFDALRWFSHGIQAVGLGGKTLHEAQLGMMLKWPPDTSIIIALDPEEIEAPFLVAKQLKNHFDEVYIARLPEGIDPGASTEKQAKEACEKARLYRGRHEILSAKLQVSKKKIAEKYQ